MSEHPRLTPGRAGTLTPVDATDCIVMLPSATAVIQIAAKHRTPPP